MDEIDDESALIPAAVGVVEDALVTFFEGHDGATVGTALGALGYVVGWWVEVALRRGLPYEGGVRELLEQAMQRGRAEMVEQQEAMDLVQSTGGSGAGGSS